MGGDPAAGPRSAPGCGEEGRTIAVYLHNKIQLALMHGSVPIVINSEAEMRA